MGQGISKLLETFSKKERGKMIADASAVLREEAKYRFPTLQYHQDRIHRLKDFLGWGARRTRSIYNGEDGVSLDGAETIALQQIKAAQEQRKKQQEEANNAEGYRVLAARFAAMEAELAALRTALAGVPMEATSGAVRGQGGSLDRSRPGSHGRRQTDRI